MNYHLSYSDWYGDKNFEANHFQLACQELTFIAWGWRQSSPRLSGETFGQTRIDSLSAFTESNPQPTVYPNNTEGWWVKLSSVQMGASKEK